MDEGLHSMESVMHELAAGDESVDASEVATAES